MQNFFFQAEDGIRDGTVTGVQTCALPISSSARCRNRPINGRVTTSPGDSGWGPGATRSPNSVEIGRASCRERVQNSVVAESVKTEYVAVKAGTTMPEHGDARVSPIVTQTK